MEAFALLCRTEGIIPAIESAHALAGALKLGRELGPDAMHPGQPVRPRRQGRRDRVELVRSGDRDDVDPDRAGHRPAAHRGRVTNDEAVAGADAGDGMSRLAERIAKAEADDRAALIGYLPVGYPTSTRRSRRCARRSRAGPTSSRSACRTATR